MPMDCTDDNDSCENDCELNVLRVTSKIVASMKNFPKDMKSAKESTKYCFVGKRN